MIEAHSPNRRNPGRPRYVLSRVADTALGRPDTQMLHSDIDDLITREIRSSTRRLGSMKPGNDWDVRTDPPARSRVINGPEVAAWRSASPVERRLRDVKDCRRSAVEYLQLESLIDGVAEIIGGLADASMLRARSCFGVGSRTDLVRHQPTVPPLPQNALLPFEHARHGCRKISAR